MFYFIFPKEFKGIIAFLGKAFRKRTGIRLQLERKRGDLDLLHSSVHHLRRKLQCPSLNTFSVQAVWFQNQVLLYLYCFFFVCFVFSFHTVVKKHRTGLFCCMQCLLPSESPFPVIDITILFKCCPWSRPYAGIKEHYI